MSGRPRYAARDVLYWVNNAAKALAGEHNGRIPDVFLLKARLKADLEKRPELIDQDRWVADCVKSWDRANHKVLGRSDRPFVPGAFITLPKRERVLMRAMIIPMDLFVWGELEDKARANFLQAMDRRRAYREEVLREGSANPDCRTLGELEEKLHGYRPAPSDDDAILFDVEESGDDTYPEV